MCGRYALTTPPDVLAALFGLTKGPAMKPRYNIAPTQIVPIVRAGEAGGREMVVVRWGLIPSWAKDPAIGNRMINARSESAATKPAFRSAFRHRRCLVPADGFYEWRKLDSGKQPYLIRRADGEPMALAGLWESWTNKTDADETIESCTVLTTDANETLSDLHDRMPVILEPESFDAWLDPEQQDAAALTAMLEPAAAGILAFHPVSRRVNSPKNDDAKLLEPAPEPVDGKPAEEPGLFT
ncbi:MAG: SOS response-associated peptidase [Planctomycetota bacterium]|jgi:putative SOS response-associated peptidase YedK